MHATVVGKSYGMWSRTPTLGKLTDVSRVISFTRPPSHISFWVGIKLTTVTTIKVRGRPGAEATATVERISCTMKFHLRNEYTLKDRKSLVLVLWTIYHSFGRTRKLKNW